MHYAKWRTQKATYYIINDSILEKTKPQGQKTDQWLPGMRGWQQRGAREFLELKEQFYKLIVMLITSLYVFVKNQRTKKNFFLIRELYTKKGEFYFHLSFKEACKFYLN